MAIPIHPQPIHKARGTTPYRVVMPLLAGGAMLGASVLPWLVDPLGNASPAWQLPVDIGWQLHSNLFSYGLLCTLCSLYAFFIAYLTWHEGNHRTTLLHLQKEPTTTFAPLSLRRHSMLAGLLCLIPISLFLIQYLIIDMDSIAQLAQHEFQALLIQNHFGYHVAAPFIPIQPDTFDPSTLHGRLALLLDQIQPGLFLPLLGTLCLVRDTHVGTGVSLPYHAQPANEKPLSAPPYHALPQGPDRQIPVQPPKYLPLRAHASGPVPFLPLIICFVLLLVILGRGPAALACRLQAKHLLSTGDYADALLWFDRASMLNPSLEQLPGYHIERGQALYYLYPTQHSIDSQAYLAGFYLIQDDYLSAYEELIAALQQNMETPTPSWLIDELDMILTRLAEIQHPLSGPPALRAHKDLPSIIWLNKLTHIDPSNVYAHYTLGRIAYDIHDFTACEKQMLSVINLSSNPNILSSAYTYLSLSSEAQGNYTKARDYLFKAQKLDPSYQNNTAREETSGLH